MIYASAVGKKFRSQRKKRAQPEQQLHKAVAAYLRLALKPPTIWTTIGHGGGGRVRGAMLKAAGVQKGWPDILILTPTIPFTRVVGLELKADQGRISAEQISVRDSFIDAGGHYIICRSVEDVATALRVAHVPLHASVGRLNNARFY